ncbi:hypothetical protein E2C01_016056 [Portunus trituberculatus]|uniref:Uncharacterized protein n=1 Tax=Portunus trituberculatus TaxID=210409 RepID=A0A5B7DN29_PORTR|nr:hypothetical protein [Portunus trituberculatus]
MEEEMGCQWKMHRRGSVEKRKIDTKRMEATDEDRVTDLETAYDGTMTVTKETNRRYSTDDFQYSVDTSAMVRVPRSS